MVLPWYFSFLPPRLLTLHLDQFSRGQVRIILAGAPGGCHRGRAPPGGKAGRPPHDGVGCHRPGAVHGHFSVQLWIRKPTTYRLDEDGYMLVVLLSVSIASLTAWLWLVFNRGPSWRTDSAWKLVIRTTVQPANGPSKRNLLI